MTVKLKTAYALLLILVLTALMIPAVGETQARYENTQVWNTVLTDLPDQVSSNLLSGDSRRPVTILLEEMEDENDVLYVDITLQSGVKTEGVLHWSNYYPYFISAEMYLNEQKLEDGVILTVPDGTDTEQRKACIDAWYRENLRIAVAQRMPYWEARTGLKCSRWTIRDMKTRWGSCTHQTAAIRVNLRLAEKPPECLDYLILHELTHIKHPNHSRAFYADVEKHMPDWHKRRMILNGKDEDQ